MPSSTVRSRRAPVILPTYEPCPPDRNPMFLERRVYQGSSGRVYPLPFYDRVAEKPRPRAWDAVFLENEYLEVMVLPELGGRIHRAVDKTNGYDFIYYQPVIKPALVGLGGPWASGGIELNWPQHHRPSTFMPTDVALEEETDGSITAWFSEHDPMARLKGMHGVRLRPGLAAMELRVRIFNRTDDIQTQLFWANAAVRAHAEYRSFFPPDVSAVVDHAKRAVSTYPLCTGTYYGVDYAARARQAGLQADPAPNDLSWYANIPVPTSYMCVGSTGDFFGGYDYRAKGGMIHVADHRIAPGKKQWTWGNHAFGHAWDRNLTDPNEAGEYPPYLELMAGVYTDNQPDFSFLAPGETKAWSQWWYPFQAIGPAQAANLDGALSLRVEGDKIHWGAAVTRRHLRAVIELTARGRRLLRWKGSLSPAAPQVGVRTLPRGLDSADLAITVAASGKELLSYRQARPRTSAPPAAATEPPPPSKVTSIDSLYLIGVHLEQYRHATRQPENYWEEALRRDPGDSRCHLALGRWRLRRGEWVEALHHLQSAVSRQTELNGNPPDGEALYHLGRCLRWLGRDEAAYDALAKAAWNQAWTAAACHGLAEIDAGRGDWPKALAHLERTLRLNVDNLRARGLQAVVLRRLGRGREADALLAESRRLDALDGWTRYWQGERLACNNQVRLDLAFDCQRAGLYADGLRILAGARDEPESGTAPMVSYVRAALAGRLGDEAARRRHLAAARAATSDYCFPSRLEEYAVLREAIAAAPDDPRARFYLGNLLYDRRRHPEAIACWEQAVRLEPANSIAWRNLGIGAFNVLGNRARAKASYAAARRANPADGRLIYESDQLAKRMGEAPARRLRRLQAVRSQSLQRDDLAVELCALYNQTGRPERAQAILASRRFQPWEGGEGQALGQHVRTHLLLGQRALAAGRADEAVRCFAAASAAPENLGEANHLLANQSDVHFWLGDAESARGDRAAARRHWRRAAEFAGDFQQMSVQPFSEKTYFSALAWRRLGRASRSRRLLWDLLKYARRLEVQKATIDYFATSLPTMLLFADDLTARQRNHARFLQAQALFGLGRKAVAARRLAAVLRADPSHPGAADLRAGLSRFGP